MMKTPRTCLLAGLLSAMMFAPALAQGEGKKPGKVDVWKSRREEMVQRDIVDAGITNQRVIDAIRATPRHEFVPKEYVKYSYVDMALPIGEQQTISPPFIVAFMTQGVDPREDDRVLEIGTGSGYQAAVLSPLVKEVYTIEIVESLGKRAAETLTRLGYENVHTKIGDGFAGWEEHAPFDQIIVTCSPEHVPQPLIDQLKEGGRMVIPVGERFQQSLYTYVKKDGKLETVSREPTIFVPMLGKAEDMRQILPDDTMPALVNYGFEDEPLAEQKPPAWHYARQAIVVDDESLAFAGKRFLRFSNETRGRYSQVLQAIGVDGRTVHQLRVSIRVRLKKARPGQSISQQPSLAVSFYNADRAPLDAAIIGPWIGTFDWKQEEATVDVPSDASSAVIVLGLMGATGEMDVDDVELSVVKEAP